MLNLYGREYVIEYCTSKMLKRRDDKLFRVYVTDALKAITENTTHYLGVSEMFDYGTTLTSRWIDILEPQEIEQEDNRSCKEIVHDIWDRIRNEQ